jgi:hypothetical protein
MPAKKTAKKVPRVHLDTPDDALAPKQTKAPAAPRSERANPADEKRRQEAYEADFSWRGEQLLGFSVSREALFGQLRLAMGAPPLSRCMADPDAFQSDAQRILFLCSHPPEILNRLRGDMAQLQTAVDSWADENLSAGDKLEAETITMKIWLAAQENRHEPAPVGNAHGDDSGN